MKEDESKSARPVLHAGDMVRGQHPKTKEWSLMRELLEMVHGNRSVNVELEDGGTRLFLDFLVAQKKHPDALNTTHKTIALYKVWFLKK